jgi:hypothetical protein
MTRREYALKKKKKDPKTWTKMFPTSMWVWRDSARKAGSSYIHGQYGALRSLPPATLLLMEKRNEIGLLLVRHAVDAQQDG